MAASSLAASNTQIPSLKLSQKTKVCMPFLLHCIKAESKPKAWRHAGVMVSQSSNKARIVCHGHSSLFTESKEASDEKTSLPAPVNQLIPNTNEVKYLLTEICDTTSIAEFQLKLNGFHLQVTRALSGTMGPTPTHSSPPVSAFITANSHSEGPAVNGSISTPSLEITKAGSLEEESQTMLERAADEGLVIIQSPKVGVFRRSRTIKGKRAPPACKEKQIVKEGQVICYIEQFGGETPVEADVSGEIIRILREDGEPVGYSDAVIEMLPSFPGIK